jgi:predicted dehydrogenase
MDKFKTAIIGTGAISQHHVEAMNAVGHFQIAAACDIDSGLVGSFAQEHNIPAYADYRKMLHEVKPDVVAICVPPGTHYKIAADALEAGCHLVLEKPACTDLLQCRELAQKACYNKRKVVLSDSSYYLPEVCAVKEYLKTKSLGPFISGSLINYKSNYYDRRPNWAFDWNLSGGGQLMNVGVHRVAVTRAILGKEEESVSAAVGSFDHRTDFEGNGSIFIRFTDNSTFSIEEIGYYSSNEAQNNFCHFNFEYGTVNLGLRGRKTQVIFSDGSTEHLEPVYGMPAYGKHYRELADSIRKDRMPYPSLIEGARDVRVILAAYESSKNRSQIDFNEENWLLDFPVTANVN